jgi:hypothetical protein
MPAIGITPSGKEPIQEQKNGSRAAALRKSTVLPRSNITEYLRPSQEKSWVC